MASAGTKEILAGFLNKLGLAWWVEVVTANPRCIYYFGPFTSEREANQATSGYLEDLQQEGAVGIMASTKRCKPAKLTDYEDSEPEISRSLSGQFQ